MASGGGTILVNVKNEVAKWRLPCLKTGGVDRLKVGSLGLSVEQFLAIFSESIGFPKKLFLNCIIQIKDLK